MQDITQVFDDLAPVNGQPMTTSRKVAARFKKAHKTVLRSIRALVETMPEFSAQHFTISPYTDSRGKTQTEYRMTNEGAALLAARMKQPWGESIKEAPPTKRPEFVFGEEIVERLFSGYTIIRQLPVFGGRYRIDWYIPELRLAVEFDEAHHASPANAAADAARQSEIEAALGCRFLRYKHTD